MLEFLNLKLKYTFVRNGFLNETRAIFSLSSESPLPRPETVPITGYASQENRSGEIENMDETVQEVSDNR
jgi:hypothetical protein